MRKVLGLFCRWVWAQIHAGIRLCLLVKFQNTFFVEQYRKVWYVLNPKLIGKLEKPRNDRHYLW